MHFSPITIGITTLFVLSRLAAASSVHVDVDVAAAPLPNPAHSRFAPHYRGENGFVSRRRLLDDHYLHPSKDIPEVPTKLRQNTMLMGTLFRRASKHHSAAPAKGVKVNSNHLAQLERQSISISQKLSLAANEYQAVQKALAGMPGAAKNALAHNSAQMRTLFGKLQELYHQQTTALQQAQASYHGTETKAKRLWGRSLNEFRVLPRRFNALSRRASGKHHGARPVISAGSLAPLEKQTLAIAAKVDEAWREQKALMKALGGAGLTGTAKTAMTELGSRIDAAFDLLHTLLHQS